MNQFLEYDLNCKILRSEVISPGNLFPTWVTLALNVNEFHHFFVLCMVLEADQGTPMGALTINK